MSAQLVEQTLSPVTTSFTIQAQHSKNHSLQLSTQASQSVAAVLAELLAVHVVTSAASANLLLPDVLAAVAVESFAAVAYSVEAAVFVDWLCLEPLVASSQSPLMMMMMMLVQHQTPTHKRK